MIHSTWRTSNWFARSDDEQIVMCYAIGDKAASVIIRKGEASALLQHNLLKRLKDFYQDWNINNPTFEADMNEGVKYVEDFAKAVGDV